MSIAVFFLILFFWAALHTSQSFVDLADFLLVVAALVTAKKNQDLKFMWKAFQPYFLWIVWIAIIISGFIFGAPVEAKTALKLIWEFRWFVSFICYIYLFKKIQWNELQIRYFTWVLLLYSVLDLFLFFVDYDRDPRAGGLFGHSMPFAHTMGPAALFLLFISFKKWLEAPKNSWDRVTYFVTPILSSAMVVLSFTRGVWIGFAAALLICSGLLGRKIFIGVLTALVLVGSVLFVGSERIQSRVMGKTNAESQSNQERKLYWKANYQIFKDYPLVGIGYSQNNIHVEEYLKKAGIDWMTGGHAHNQYIHFLAGTGILGLSCFLAFLFLVFYSVFLHLLELRKQRPFSDRYYLLVGVFAGMLCFVIGSLTESNFSIAKNRFMFLFLAAVGYAISTYKSAKNSQK